MAGKRGGKQASAPGGGQGQGSPKRRALIVVCVVAALVVVGSAAVIVALLLGRGSGGASTPAEQDGAQVPESFGEVATEEELAAGESEAEDELDAWIADYLARSDVRETLSAADEGASLSEAEAYVAFQERGFDPAEVTTTYEQDGSYHEGQGISADSTTRHPDYTLVFPSASGEYWVVSCYGDCFTAMPVARSMEEGRTPVTLSEQETMISYDADNNTLYRLVPPSDELTLRQVERVSADYLNSLSAEEVSAL